MKQLNFKILYVFLGLLFLGLAIQFGFDSFIQLILIYVLINMILSMSLNLVNGLTGQFSLGHAGFMAIGGYTSAYVSTLLPKYFSTFINLQQNILDFGYWQFPYFLFLALLGGSAAALAGYFVGLPSLRLKGDYLAIVTLGFGEIIRVILLNTPAVGGARGLPAIPGPNEFTTFGLPISKFFICYLHSIFWVMFTFILIWRLLEGHQGRSFLSVREDEVAAESIGIDTTQTKVRAFVISSFLAGVAGSLFAHFTNYLNPASFNFNRSVDAVIMVVLGGMGSLTGSLFAAVFITLIPELLRPLQEYTGVDIRMVLYSLSLVLLMILRPEGLFGRKEMPDLIQYLKRKFSS
jgi:branched-chain amino acid transport system permease protein